MGDDMKQEWRDVIGYVAKVGGVTFAELENRFEWLGGGNQELILTGPNLLMWTGLSAEGVAFYMDRGVRDQLEPSACSWLLYADDGKMLRMPIAKRPPKGGYKKQRWVPTMLSVRDGMTDAK